MFGAGMPISCNMASHHLLIPILRHRAIDLIQMFMEHPSWDKCPLIPDHDRLCKPRQRPVFPCAKVLDEVLLKVSGLFCGTMRAMSNDSALLSPLGRKAIVATLKTVERRLSKRITPIMGLWPLGTASVATDLHAALAGKARYHFSQDRAL